MTKTTDGNLFLQYDSGINTDRILIFSTTNLLKLMTQCNNWFCDGTFSSAPTTYLLYKCVIHCLIHFNSQLIHYTMLRCYCYSVTPYIYLDSQNQNQYAR